MRTRSWILQGLAKGGTDARQAWSHGNVGRGLRSRGGLEDISQWGIHRTLDKCLECRPLMEWKGLAHFSYNSERSCLSPCTTDISVTYMFQALYNNRYCFYNQKGEMFYFSSLRKTNPSSSKADTCLSGATPIVTHLELSRPSQPQGVKIAFISSVNCGSSDLVFLILPWFWISFPG